MTDSTILKVKEWKAQGSYEIGQWYFAFNNTYAVYLRQLNIDSYYPFSGDFYNLFNKTPTPAPAICSCRVIGNKLSESLRKGLNLPNLK